MVEMISEKHGTRRHRSKVERRRIVEETLKEWRGKTGAIHLAEERHDVDRHVFIEQDPHSFCLEHRQSEMGG